MIFCTQSRTKNERTKDALYPKKGKSKTKITQKLFDLEKTDQTVGALHSTEYKDLLKITLR